MSIASRPDGLRQIPALVATVLALLAPVPVPAQTVPPVEYLELSPADRGRLDALMRDQAEKDAKAIAELKALRDKLLRTPPLPAERNPLLGQWKVEGRARKTDALADMFDSLVNIEKAKCEMLFGADSVTEFRAKDWASNDSFGNDSLGSIQYRGSAKQVWLIPDKSISTGMMFFSFEFVDANRVNVLSPTINEDCSLNRVGGSTRAVAAAGSNSAAPPPIAAVAPQPSTASTAPAAKAATGFAVLRVHLGGDTVASVERDIQARGGSPSVGGGGHGKYTLSGLSGDYSDAGPGVMAVNYDFDAAGPAGRLIAVTIARKVAFGAPYAKLVADRKAALAKVFGALKSKSATEHSGSTAGCDLTLFENPDGGWLYEVYRLSN